MIWAVFILGYLFFVNVWDLAVDHVQGMVGPTTVPDPIHLDLTVSQVQGSVSPAWMLDPVYLDLTVNQVQVYWVRHAFQNQDIRI